MFDSFDSLKLNEQFTIVTALIALALSIISMIRTHISLKKEREIQITTRVHDYYENIRKWADETILELSKAAFLCDLDPQHMPDGEFFKKRHYVRTRLSSLLDQGRLFLPNSDQDIIGIWKEGAYRGLRQKALDCLANAYTLVEELDSNNQTPNKSKREEIIDEKREFVSEIQDILEVRLTTQEINRLEQEIRKA